ncbi:MAG TPA: hypothetical protein DD381_13755 [Lentisphaeria bacterium]|nr:MAG: hypothetical protein A2X47_13770 [Lentisphaerae bacterium GWF2_38_69]HBM17387.1 hypothetical protein [Lentisphaeria bacterium]
MKRIVDRFPLTVACCLLPVACCLLFSCVSEKTKDILVSYKSSNIEGYENKPVIIDSEFLSAMYRIDHYAKINGVKIIVTSSFRTPDQTLEETIVPPSKRSNHLAGHAIDMNVEFNAILYDSKVLKKSNLNRLPPNVRNFINDIRNDKGLRWGGDFSNEDPVHIDDNLNSNPIAWQERFDACQYGR